MTGGVIASMNSGRYVANAAAFDASDYLYRDSAFSGAASSNEFTLVIWLNPVALGTTKNILRIIGSSGYEIFRVLVGANATDDIGLQAFSNGGATSLINYYSAATLSTGTQYCLMFSSDGTTFQAYNKDTALAHGSMSSPILSSGDIPFGSMGGTNAIKIMGTIAGTLADVYLNTAERIDFSVEANRRKFVTAAGKPVFLGFNGALPTGTAPTLYLRSPYGSYGTNSGTGGNLSVSGSLAAGTSPSA